MDEIMEELERVGAIETFEQWEDEDPLFDDYDEREDFQECENDYMEDNPQVYGQENIE